MGAIKTIVSWRRFRERVATSLIQTRMQCFLIQIYFEVRIEVED